MLMDINTYDAIIPAPFGAVAIKAHDDFLVAVELLAESLEKPAVSPFAANVASQVARWLRDPQQALDVPVAVSGTPFQKRVWQAIASVPLGATVSYGELASAVGSGPRAVANVCGANRIPLFIPCHRVLAKNGLGGFMQGHSRGLEIKRWLLAHEGVHAVR